MTIAQFKKHGQVLTSGFSSDYNTYSGTAKSFWRNLIRANSEEDARELKRMMDASSLSHAQAKKLLIYSLRNPSDDGYNFLYHNLLQPLFGDNFWDMLSKMIDIAIKVKCNDEVTKQRFENFLEQYGISESIMELHTSLKLWNILAAADWKNKSGELDEDTQEEWTVLADFLNDFRTVYPFESQTDEMLDEQTKEDNRSFQLEAMKAGYDHLNKEIARESVKKALEELHFTQPNEVLKFTDAIAEVIRKKQAIVKSQLEADNTAATVFLDDIITEAIEKSKEKSHDTV